MAASQNFSGFVFACFLVMLIILKLTVQMFCRMDLGLGLNDVFLMIRLG